MTNEIVERMKKHVGKGESFMLEGDKFTLLPLTLEDYPELYDISSSLYDKGDAGFDKDVVSRLITLIKKSCMRSPDIDTSNAELLDAFIAANFISMLNTFMKANMPAQDKLPADILEKGVKLMKDGRGPTLIKPA